MAFTPTLLQDGILRVREVNGLGFQENERRRSAYGALEAANVGVDKLIPATTLTQLKEASAHATSVDVFVKEANGTLAARKCSGTGTGTTANVALSYQSFYEEFQISDVEHHGNRAKMADAFAHLLNERLKSLHSRVNAAAITDLEAKAVASAGTFGATVANATQFAAADRLNFFNQMKTNLEENDFFGPYENVHSFSQSELVRYDQAQGGANATNLQFQLGDYNHYASTGITNGVGVESTGYIFERGTFGMIPWINPTFRGGKDIGSDVWTTMADPFGLLGTLELKVKKECADNSGSFTGAEADYVESYVLGLEVAFVSAYDSTGTNSGIYKTEVLS